ncbi:MAG: hypothetical protein ABSH03_03275 [Candidatus Lustribacter sp.]|jgi:Skp family chaperone for outer membrane proteins
MFAFGRFLRYFQGGVPGAPSTAGVPVDRRSELEAELAPVFAALEGAQREAQTLTAQAQADAERMRADATDRARRRVDDARAAAAADQAATATEQLERAQAEAGRIVAAGAAEADRIDRAVQAGAPPLVSELVGRVLEPAS